MNTRRILFWSAFVLTLGLIVWGLAVAMKKSPSGGAPGTPAPISAEDHVFGPANAPVTIIEYSDFQCPACREYFYLVKRFLSENPDKVRFVYRHFPLPQHANAILAAMASEAAAAQGKFWDMYDALFTNYAEWAESPNPTDIFNRYAGGIGLDSARFKADISSSTLRDRVSANKDDAIRIGVNATPTFFVNGKAITNPPNYDQFKALIETAASGASN